MSQSGVIACMFFGGGLLVILSVFVMWITDLLCTVRVVDWVETFAMPALLVGVLLVVGSFGGMFSAEFSEPAVPASGIEISCQFDTARDLWECDGR